MSQSYSEEFPVLPAHGLYAADILGDGNCLFNALSDQMYGNQNQHHILRARTIDHMRENADLYKPFITCFAGGGVRRNPKRKTANSSDSNASGPSPEQIDRVFEEHLQRMAKGGTWGDNMEIAAFSSAFDVTVKIYQRDNVLSLLPNGTQGGKATCHIAYHEWEHYSSIRNIDGPHEGLPNVKPKNLPTDESNQPANGIQGTSFVQPYMVDLVKKSLPYGVDEQVVIRVLEESRGNVNNAVDRLLEGDEHHSVSSQQSSGSFDRDSESSDDIVSGPSKKQDRRLSRTSKTAMRIREMKRRQQIASKLDTIGGSLDSLINVTPSVSGMMRRKRSIIEDSDDESSPFEPLRDGDTSSGSEYSGSVSVPPPVPSITGIKLKLTPYSPRPLSAPVAAPVKQLTSARDRKVIKKLAQKAAAKERKQTSSPSPKKASKTPDTSASHNPTPAVVSTGIVGLKTLYI